MNSFAYKRIFAFVIACLMLCSAAAAYAETALVMQDAVVYAAAKTSSKKLGKLEAGTKLDLIAEKGGWAKVELNGNVGYMDADAVAEYKSYDGKTAYTAKSTAMYKSFSTSSKKLGTIPKGEKVSVSATAGSWARATYNGYTGFVKLSNLTTTAPAKEETFDSYTAYAKADNTKVYNAKGKVIGKVAVNTKVTVTAEKNGICQVKRGDTTAYMKKSDLSTSKIEVKEETFDSYTAYAKADNTKVYNAKGEVIGKVAVNTKVTVTAEKSGICQVKRGDTTAYMKKSDLSTSKVEEKNEDDGITEISPTTYYVQNDGAKVYDADGNVMTTLDVNTAVTVTAYNDQYAKVTNGSSVGLMLKSDLATKKVETKTEYVVQYGDKGEAVSKIQARLKELGYFTGTVGGNYLDLTKSAVTAFQAAAGLTTTGVCDEKTLTAMFSEKAPQKETEKEESSSSGPSTATPAKGTAVAMDWWTSDIQSIFSRGTIATITDVATGIAWYEKRTGGTNHADVQPVTAADTATMKKAVGGWSWNRRAIFVTINGVNYAASMNCMPHGSDSIASNNFDGHHCIHFTNSRTHGSNKVCSLHQAAIKKAANATL